MSKSSALAAIRFTLNNAIPAIDLETMEGIKSIEDDGAANEAHRAIVKLQNLRETKLMQYKQAADRIKYDQMSTINTIDTYLIPIKNALEKYSRPKKDGQHFDLPDGRVQFHSSPVVTISEGVTGEQLTEHLKALYKSTDPDLKACAKVEVSPVRDAIKAAINKNKLNVPWVSITRSETVNYNENHNDTHPDSDSAEEPGRGKDSANLSNESPESTIGKGFDPAKNEEKPATFTGILLAGLLPDQAPSSTQTAAPAKAAPQAPASPAAAAPAGTPLTLAQGEPMVWTSSETAAAPLPPVAPPPPEIDLVQRPRIFQAPNPVHFDQHKLLLNAQAFAMMNIKELLVGQDAVKPEHIHGVGVAIIKAGFKAEMDKLGMSRDDVKRWVAYHLGVDFATLDPIKIEDRTWRMLLALAIHASTVRAKYPVRADASLSQGTGAAPQA